MSNINKLKAKANPINYIETRAEATISERTIKGYLAIFGKQDKHGTIFVKGAFSKSIQERGPESDSNYKITLLWQHDMRNPIGRITVLREDDKGLYFEAEIDDVEDGNRALKQIQSGTLNQFSFGFRYIWDKVEYDEETESYIVKEVDLIEGSVVTMGSQGDTHAIRSIEELEQKEMTLKENIELSLKSIPRAKQLELRKSITDYISLLEAKPNITLQKRAEEKENVDFSLLLTKIK
jgi:HK97 family phage prohead protease